MVTHPLPPCRTDTPLSTVFLNDFWGQPLSDPESHKSYRPLTILSFRLNRLLHGMWTPGFHSVNNATHATVCVLFLWLCLVLRFSLGASVAAALLFTVHPVHTEAVRMNAMCIRNENRTRAEPLSYPRKAQL